MKKITFIIPLFFLVTACNSNEQDLSEQSTDDEIGWIEQGDSELHEEPSVSFNNNLLKFPEGNIKFTSQALSEIYDEQQTVAIEFDYTNVTDQPQKLDFILWDYIHAKQNLGDVTVPLAQLVVQDDSPYYEKAKAFDAEVNPGATVSTAVVIIVEDETKPFFFEFTDTSGQIVGEKEYSFKEEVKNKDHNIEKNTKNDEQKTVATTSLTNEEEDENEKSKSFEKAQDYLNKEGFNLWGYEEHLYSSPLSSGVAQMLWIATQSKEEAEFVRANYYPILKEASNYFEDVEILLETQEGNDDIFLIAENGEITYSIID